MARQASGKTPPSLDLREAINDVEEIKNQGGGELHRDNFATIKKSTVKSSKFQMGLVALRAYGLIEGGMSKIKLTSLGIAIADPTSPEDRQRAILKSFCSIPLFKTLHQKYQGGNLPESIFLGNIIQTEYSYPKESKNKWVACFIESAKTAGLLQNIGGKFRVLSSPITQDSKNSDKLEYLSNEQVPYFEEERGEKTSKLQAKPIIPKDISSLNPIGFGDGRIAYIPFDLNEDDLTYLKAVLDAYVKRKSKK